MKKLNNDLADNVIAQLGEWLDSYIVIGFDMEGQRVQLRQWRDCKSFDAVRQAVRDAMTEHEYPKPVMEMVEDGQGEA